MAKYKDGDKVYITLNGRIKRITNGEYVFVSIGRHRFYVKKTALKKRA